MALPDDRPQNLERREQLLLVARKVFAERGFTATTMEDIAKEAGFTKPILYQFFKSKSELYNEIIKRTSEQLISRLRDAVAEKENAQDRIEVAFQGYFDMVVRETDAFRILFIHSHDSDTVIDLRDMEIDFVAFIERLITIRIKPDHRRQLAASVVGIAEGAATAWLMQQENRGWPAPEPGIANRLAARATALAWGGLRSVEQD
ncbi:MAG: TetR/AcrR family transcriptional regulator [Actinomycetota bacterium]